MNIRKNIIAALLYSISIIGFVLVSEIVSHDKTGQGLVALPMLSILFLALHSGVIVLIYIYSLIKRRKENFKTFLITMFAVIGINIATPFAGIFIISAVFNLFDKLGFLH